MKKFGKVLIRRSAAFLCMTATGMQLLTQTAVAAPAVSGNDLWQQEQVLFAMPEEQVPSAMPEEEISAATEVFPDTVAGRDGMIFRLSYPKDREPAGITVCLKEDW